VKITFVCHLGHFRLGRCGQRSQRMPPNLSGGETQVYSSIAIHGAYHQRRVGSLRCQLFQLYHRLWLMPRQDTWLSPGQENRKSCRINKSVGRCHPSRRGLNQFENVVRTFWYLFNAARDSYKHYRLNLLPLFRRLQSLPTTHKTTMRFHCDHMEH
jgi:hypothetical protein